MAVNLERGRPKSIIKREIQVNLKLTKFEAEKISKIAKEKNLTKTDAILKGIDLLIRDKPKIYKNLKKKSPKISKGNIPDDEFEDF